MNVIQKINGSRMKAYQWLIVGVCVFSQMVDGFDLFIMGFVSPFLPDGFATPTEKGFLLSAGLIGMAIGAGVVAPWADRIGRRKMLLFALGLNVIGTAMSALAPGYLFLMATRLITGIGVGAVTATVIIICQEFSSAKRRSFAIGLVTGGYALGSTVAGATGVSVMALFDGAWQAMFIVGCVLGLVAFILAFLFVPESIAFLLTHQNPKQDEKIISIAKRLSITVDEVVHEQSGEIKTGSSRSTQGLFSPRYRETTILLWAGYTFLTAAYYFVGTWTPQLIADASGSAQNGAIAGSIIASGGLVGAVVFGIIGLKVEATKIGWTSLAVAIVSLLVFSAVMSTEAGLIAAAVLGLAVFVAVSSFSAMAPPMYPANLRARGYGLMVSISRLGAIVTPILAGFAATFMEPVYIFLAAVIPLAISAVAVFRLWRKSRQTGGREEGIEPRGQQDTLTQDKQALLS